MPTLIRSKTLEKLIGLGINKYNNFKLKHLLFSIAQSRDTTSV